MINDGYTDNAKHGTRQKPVCRKCNGVHYGYQPCNTSEAITQERKLIGTGMPLQVIEDPSRRGLKPWSGVHDSGLINGGLVFSTLPMKKRGSVTPARPSVEG